MDFAGTGKKEPNSHIYMCLAELHGNHRESPTGTFVHLANICYIGLILLFYSEIVKILLRDCHLWCHYQVFVEDMVNSLGGARDIL